MLNINNLDIAKQHAQEIREDILRRRLAAQIRHERKTSARMERLASRHDHNDWPGRNAAGAKPSFWQKLLAMSRRML